MTTRPDTHAAPRTTQIRRLFVANRGEIARRIARTCSRLGIVAIIPRTDPSAPGSIDLLDGDAVVKAARNARADALHPGYGFLAESPAFADAVEAAGLCWVGPPAGAIAAMGDKAGARRLASSLGVEVVPGYDDPDQSDAALARAADRIGLPLIVKPAAGGGGKGMRVVRRQDELVPALAAARREARAAFGEDRLILERLVEGSRHVEIQVLFDAAGAGVHFGERDCSIQRRHQKILEETPSPSVDAALRSRLADAALRIAAAVDYRSVGTVEFLLADDRRFYFLEMNTRLQVEHTVTELVTGRDLVADQLGIATGRTLVELRLRPGLGDPLAAGRGHAVEARLYAEDAEAAAVGAEGGFLPAIGRVEAIGWPRGPGIRIDAGIDVGTNVTGAFDPLLAKVCAHGKDRATALDRLMAALDGTTVLGLTTNLRFLRWLVRQDVVGAGEARTDSLERIWPPDDLADRAAVPPEAWAEAASILVAIPTSSEDCWSGGWRITGRPVVRVATDGNERSVEVPAGMDEAAGGATRRPVSVLAGQVVHVDVDGRSQPFSIAPAPDVDRAARAAERHLARSAPIEAPMPGTILALHAGRGDALRPGEPVLTIEAMKMEHVVRAPIGGRLAELDAVPGQRVARGQALGLVESEDTREPATAVPPNEA